MNRVMVCAIARNEEHNLRKWFNSVKSADTIVLVDTGSTDNTVAVARSLTHPDLRILSIPFADPAPYDLMRNVSFAQATDPNTFCMWIDIDECFVGNWAHEVRMLPEDISALMVEMQYDDIRYDQLKGFRAGTHSWKYALHEVPVAVIANPKTVHAQFHTVHQRQHGKAYRDHHMALLNMDLQRYPNDPRTLFYLVRQHGYEIDTMIHSNTIDNDEIDDYYYATILPLFNRLEQTHDTFYIATAALEISRKIQLKSTIADEAVRLAMLAYYLAPQRPETVGQLAIASYYNSDDFTCIGYSLKCLQMPVLGNFMFDESDYYKDQVVYYLVKSCTSLGFNDKAIFYACKYERHDLLERFGLNMVGTLISGKAEIAPQTAS